MTIGTLWLREMKRFIRSPSRIVGNLSMPIIWLTIMGFGLSSSFSLPGGGAYISYMAPGVIGMTLLFTSIFAGISVIWDRQFGFLKEILVAPASRMQIVLGKLAGSVTISLINGIIILAIATLIGAIPLGWSILNLLSAVAIMAMISASFVSIGLIIASKLDNMEGFQMIMSFLVMPMFFLSGAFFPITNAPIWMQALSGIDPLRYGVDALRGLLIGVHELPLLLDGGVLIGFTFALIVIASWRFRNMKA